MTDHLQTFAADLAKYSSAEVYLDLPTRLLYSTDASNYKMMPLAVVVPRHDDDVLATAETCSKLGLPMLPRGGASSLAGQTVGEAVVIDFTKYLDKVIRVDAQRRRVLTQPGITLDVLNRHLASYGLMIGPDPASSDRATIGGIIGNNSTGSHSIAYGMMSDHVISLRAVLADGKESQAGASFLGGDQAKKPGRRLRLRPLPPDSGADQRPTPPCSTRNSPNTGGGRAATTSIICAANSTRMTSISPRSWSAAKARSA